MGCSQNWKKASVAGVEGAEGGTESGSPRDVVLLRSLGFTLTAGKPGKGFETGKGQGPIPIAGEGSEGWWLRSGYCWTAACREPLRSSVPVASGSEAAQFDLCHHGSPGQWAC